jgi:hypothetical protein
MHHFYRYTLYIWNKRKQSKLHQKRTKIISKFHPKKRLKEGSPRRKFQRNLVILITNDEKQHTPCRFEQWNKLWMEKPGADQRSIELFDWKVCCTGRAESHGSKTLQLFVTVICQNISFITGWSVANHLNSGFASVLAGDAFRMRSVESSETENLKMGNLFLLKFGWTANRASLDSLWCLQITGKTSTIKGIHRHSLEKKLWNLHGSSLNN